MNSYMPGIYNEVPPEIQLIRQMTRTSATVKKENGYNAASQETPGEAFIIKQAADWLEDRHQQAEAGKLFDSFWFEGELCILFADTNVGKSILAVQIGDSISRGEPIGNFEMKTGPGAVLYFDFELTTRQFIQRYTGGAYGNYRFNTKFLRAVINPEATGARKFNNYEEYINNALENSLITTKAKILIIDNITCLRYGTHAATGALNLMRNLQALKSKYGLSILVLAHTPKRNPARPLTRNDLQGSKMLINFCDSAFSIGESHLATGLRYLKQIKQRNVNELYGADRVCLCRIIKPFNFLQFEFTGYSDEDAHLLRYTEQYRKKQEAKIIELNKQGLSLRQVADRLNICNSTVCRTLKRLKGQEELKS